jgi:hypothetical protein
MAGPTPRYDSVRFSVAEWRYLLLKFSYLQECQSPYIIRKRFITFKLFVLRIAARIDSFSGLGTQFCFSFPDAIAMALEVVSLSTP